MFEYSLSHWLAFLTATVLLNLSPGPDLAFILGQTVKGGTRLGVAAMLGIWTGTLCHVVIAALGIATIIANSPETYAILKLAGAGYLIWLGVQALRNAGRILGSKNETDPDPVGQIYLRGVLVNALNPKAALFFLAFLPQFIVEGSGPPSAQLLFHGLLVLVVAVFIELPIVIAGGKISNGLRTNRSIAKWLDRSLGVLFIGLGIRLAANT